LNDRDESGRAASPHHRILGLERDGVNAVSRAGLVTSRFHFGFDTGAGLWGNHFNSEHKVNPQD